MICDNKLTVLIGRIDQEASKVQLKPMVNDNWYPTELACYVKQEVLEHVSNESVHYATITDPQDVAIDYKTGKKTKVMRFSNSLDMIELEKTFRDYLKCYFGIEELIFKSTETRDNHLNWCKYRALRELAYSGDSAAMASMLSDLNKHPETADPPANGLGLLQMLFCKPDMEQWILGYE